MQTNHEIFILVAEEMSISNASKKAFVSQQCVSDHIKRIEQEYGLIFFTRKPRFQLTPAGKSLLQSLYKIKSIESMMKRDMTQRLTGESGSLTIGINASRAQVILPKVLPDYTRDFTDVKINFLLDDTIGLEEKLLQGKIDAFLGINTSHNKDFHYIHLHNDPIYLLISEGLMRKSFDDEKYSRVQKNAKLDMFSNVPFSSSYKTGAINTLLDTHLNSINLKLHTPIRISDIDTQILLCAQEMNAMFCPEMLLKKIPAHNRIKGTREYIHIIPLDELNYGLRLDLVSLKHIEKPKFFMNFLEVLHKNIKKTPEV